MKEEKGKVREVEEEKMKVERKREVRKVYEVKALPPR